jgi:hypothetical protein
MSRIIIRFLSFFYDGCGSLLMRTRLWQPSIKERKQRLTHPSLFDRGLGWRFHLSFSCWKSSSMNQLLLTKEKMSSSMKKKMKSYHHFFLSSLSFISFIWSHSLVCKGDTFGWDQMKEIKWRWNEENGIKKRKDRKIHYLSSRLSLTLNFIPLILI